MPIVQFREGEHELLDQIFRNEALGTLYLHLFINDVTPSNIMTTFGTVGTEDLVVPTASGGYAMKAMARGTSWAVTTGDVDDASYATFTEQTWTFTADKGTAYGWLITDGTTGAMIWAERFTYAEPTFNGKIINVLPKIKLGKLDAGEAA